MQSAQVRTSEFRKVAAKLSLVLLAALLASQAIADDQTAEVEGIFDDLLEPNSASFRMLQKGAVALECAAIARRFDSQESQRLLTVGYDALLQVFGELEGRKIREALKSAPGPFNELREVVAFMAGQLHGGSSKDLLAQYMESPENDVERFYQSEFDARNCGVIGR